MAIKQYKNQQGVVLLSVLAFLILILLLLKISLQSGRMDAFKAGIHYEIMNATEASELAQTAARDFIMAGGYDASGDAIIKKASISACSENANSQNCINALNKVVFEYWRDLVTFPAGSYLVSDSDCGDGDNNAAPFWKCVDWDEGLSGSSAITSAMISSSYQPSLVTDGHFPGNDAPRFAVQLLSRSETTIMFRVYSIGFGQSSGGQSLTTKLIESTYLLPLESHDE